MAPSQPAHGDHGVGTSTLFEDTPDDPDQSQMGLLQDQQKIQLDSKSKSLFDSQQSGESVPHDNKVDRGKRKAHDDLSFTPRRSKRIANFDGYSQKEEHEHGASQLDGTLDGDASADLNQANAGQSIKKPISEYYKALEKIRKIEADGFASSAELFQAQKTKKLLEAARARGDYGDVSEEAGGTSEPGLQPPQRNKNQSGPREKPLPAAGPPQRNSLSTENEKGGCSRLAEKSQSDRVAAPVFRSRSGTSGKSSSKLII